MDSLPHELLESILTFNIHMCRDEKNKIFPLRLVCKAFDAFLKPYIFKTIQLEFSRFLRHGPTPDLTALGTVGNLCQAIYLDMMVVRDEAEISFLTEMFQQVATKVPEMGLLLDSLRRYCMSESTFDETDFRRVMDEVLLATPNLTRLRLSLPINLMGRDGGSTDTLLAATTLACLACRPLEEHKPLETLVLDHIRDTTIISITNNPIDLRNALVTFEGLKHLVMTIARRELRQNAQGSFASNLWFLIRKAKDLESLCLCGYSKRDKPRLSQGSPSLNEWFLYSLPYDSGPPPGSSRLRYLKLKQVNIDPRDLLRLIEHSSTSLKEIYLSQVRLKIRGSAEGVHTPLWIGNPDQAIPDGSVWIARSLRRMKNLHLDVLRATNIGYDVLERDGTWPARNYDLTDPSGHSRSFDQRFVEAAFGNDAMVIRDAIPPTAPVTSDFEERGLPPADGSMADDPLQTETPERDYDSEVYQRLHDTICRYEYSVDGYFINRNNQIREEVKRITGLARKGLALISAEIARLREATINSATGTLDTNPSI